VHGAASDSGKCSEKKINRVTGRGWHGLERAIKEGLSGLTPLQGLAMDGRTWESPSRQRESKCKGPEAGVGLRCSRNSRASGHEEVQSTETQPMPHCSAVDRHVSPGLLSSVCKVRLGQINMFNQIKSLCVLASAIGMAALEELCQDTSG
jgi:hypothetical protein